LEIAYSLQIIINCKKKKKTVFLHDDDSIIEMGMLLCLLSALNTPFPPARATYLWKREMLEWRASAAGYFIVMGGCRLVIEQSPGCLQLQDLLWESIPSSFQYSSFHLSSSLIVA